MNKPLPKSLHTVTVLVRVAKAIGQYEGLDHDCMEVMELTLSILGADTSPDNYGLVDAALKQLRK
jgi:hypothetical protein